METSPNPAPVQSEASELRSQYEQLQQLVSSLLLILIVVSGTLSVFLLRQWRFVKAELAQWQRRPLRSRPNTTTRKRSLRISSRNLPSTDATHPDFAPISDRYHLNDFLAKPGTSSVTSSLPTSVLRRSNSVRQTG